MAKLHPDQWIFIYGLRDPRTMAMRYIGSSVHPRTRLIQHMSDTLHYGYEAPKNRWLRELKAENLEPILVLLARVKERFRNEHESWFISFYGDGLMNAKRV